MQTNSIPAVAIATDSKGNPIYPSITEIIGSTVFTSPIIAVQVSTTVPPERTWKYAGRCTRVVDTGLGASYAERKPLFLSKFNLINFTDFDADYTVNILVPKWFISASILIYQYEGTNTTTAEQELDNIGTKLEV